MKQVRNIALLLKPGDYVVLLLVLLLVAMLFAAGLHSPPGHMLIVRAKGQVIAELPLQTQRTLRISGTLGNSLIEVAAGRARVIGDPGPRQICVKQGWISRAGDVLLCLANQVTLEIPGQSTGYDSLNY
jgi:hypothetical protein